MCYAFLYILFNFASLINKKTYIYIYIYIFIIFAFITIGQVRTDRKWSGRKIGGGGDQGKVLKDPHSSTIAPMTISTDVFP